MRGSVGSEAEEEYRGGAVFWSPRKVKEARDCQHQQGLEEEQRQQQKAEAAYLREEKRQEKLQAAQQRREARTQAQKTAQRGKRRRKRGRLKVPTKAGLKKRIATQRKGGGEASGAAAGPPPPQSRHGQAIKLAAKYR
ncbi:hypothetical protein CC86DRAFT_378002 [Ophiobolus disseminans]|uniref:Uncharacterized protein n=1 Tax=Ophiobolus disseminans TaxID=1469910 RepID=A0A6A7AEK0_9PLEO|nr:hypothetical protein CC86DRAFT_378002 [Ophiobolus disseminans]